MNSPNLTMEALELLKGGYRREAAGKIAQDLAQGPPQGERWRSVGRLAAHIGEIDLSLEATRRFAETEPRTLARLIHYVGELATFGRSEEAMAILEGLPGDATRHPAALHVKATLLAERGQHAKAIPLFRAAIAATPGYGESWFPLAMSTKFSADSADLEQLEAETPRALQAPPIVAAQHFFALGKAYRDLGDDELAFAQFDRGAQLRRGEERYDRAGMERMAQKVIADFTPENLASLKRSGAGRPQSIFVNGVPRSGSTLVEQILVSHSAVADGGEVNLARAALTPTVDFSLAGARKLEARSGTSNPWTDIAEDYDAMVRQRFRTDLRVVDKTLNQSFLMGLLLHAMPEARVIWMRRRPADSALSCYTTSFSTPVPWSWSFEDIGHFFSLDNMLFEHWTRLFPDNILVVPYEELVAAPDAWVRRIADHAGLEFEPGMLSFHENRRAIRTASSDQVRQPLSTARVGSAERYRDQLQPFFDSYRG